MDAGPIAPAPGMEAPGRGTPRITRRKLLIGAGGAAALAVGYAIWPRERALNLAVRPDETLVNAWLKIGLDGRVVVAVPQAEMGQGVYTALPQLLAGELGADWEMVSVEPAPLHPVYANRAFVEGVGEGMPSLLAGIVKWAAISVVERFELQATGGSTSVMAFWEPLRLAGASARELLVRAASRSLDIDPAELDTAGGYVEGGGRRVAFADLLPFIDLDDAPAEPRLRESGSFVGRSLPRLDVPSKVNGTAMFGADVRLPGMVYAAVRGAPLGAGERIRFGGAPAAQADRILGVVEGAGWYAVIGETWWDARQALDLVDTAYAAETLADSDEIEAALQAALADESAGTAFVERGDLAAALATGRAVEAEYSVPFVAHACLEPMTATVSIDGSRAEVWAPTQSQTLTAWKVADALDIPTRNVTVYPTLLGGGFGRKAEVDACVQAALIARQAGRPVQLIWHREEDMARDKFRPAARVRMRGAAGKDGRLTALDAKLAAPNLGADMAGRMAPGFLKGIAASGGDSAAMVKGLDDPPYAVPAHRVAHAHIDTAVPLGYWRSVEHSYAAFFQECFIDELAARAGLDPLEFRLRSMDRQSRAARVLMLAASRGTLLAPSASNIGRGIALHPSFGSYVAQVAEVEASAPDAFSVTKVSCVIDCGQVVNPDIVRQQMEGGIIFGLTAALYGRIRFANGEPDALNFGGYPLLSMAEAPEIDVHIVESDEAPGGVGEPGVPPIAPAVANAVFAATGARLRHMPFLMG